MIYEFDSGSELPAHQHAPDMAHNVIVLEGCVRLELEEGHQVVKEGEILDFDNSKVHAIRALMPSRTLHLFLAGMPHGYDQLPPHELSGTIP